MADTTTDTNIPPLTISAKTKRESSLPPPTLPETMPSFKSLSSKVLGGIKKRGTGGTDLDGESGRSGGSDSAVDLQGDTPEAVAARAVV